MKRIKARLGYWLNQLPTEQIIKTSMKYVKELLDGIKFSKIKDEQFVVTEKVVGLLSGNEQITDWFRLDPKSGYIYNYIYNYFVNNEY